MSQGLGQGAAISVKFTFSTCRAVFVRSTCKGDGFFKKNNGRPSCNKWFWSLLSRHRHTLEETPLLLKLLWLPPNSWPLLWIWMEFRGHTEHPVTTGYFVSQTKNLNFGKKRTIPYIIFLSTFQPYGPRDRGSGIPWKPSCSVDSVIPSQVVQSPILWPLKNILVATW